MSSIADSRNDGRTLDSVAIIMDGNGRWATRRGLPRKEGHVAGAKVLGTVLKKFHSLGVHNLTLYAFSTENWKRPKEEVEALMSLFYTYITRYALPEVKRNPELGIRFIGDLSALPERLREKCREVERLSEGRSFICRVAINYGGRAEIVNAANRAIKDGVTSLTEDILSSYMYTSPAPDPDLVIRTGGDFRISNFLLWQIAYAEFVILDTLWPDITEDDIDRSVEQYFSRQRRFGGVVK